MSRVVVIGAGVGGLATAARLAHAGHEVTVFEQAAAVGGKLGRVVRRTPVGDFTFDTGPSLLTLPQVFVDLFAETGSRLWDELDLVPLDPIVRHVFADGSVLDSCSDEDEFARRIEAAFGRRAAADWRRLFQRAESIWDISWRRVLTSNVESWRAAARLAWRLGELRTIAPGRTLRGIGRTYLADPRLRMLLDRYATYLGSDPRRAPAALVAIPYAELKYGGWYVRGGLARIADALLARAQALGATVHTGVKVAGIDAARGRVRSVRLADGRVHPADVVVANADAASVYRDLLPSPRRSAQLTERSVGGFVLLLGVRGRTAGLGHHTVFFPADHDAEFDAIFTRPARPVPDPAVFVTVADDPHVRPDGYEGWFILVNAPPHGPGPAAVDWTKPGVAEAYADAVLSALAARGVDVRDRVVFREVRTPADLERETGSPGGAIYGTPSHGLTGLIRPANRGPVGGLFLVGGSTHPGGGLPMVALSAKIVADAIGPAE